MNDKEKNMERFFTKTTLKGISKVTEYVAKKTEYIKLDRDKSTFKSHRDFSSEKEISFKHF